MELPARTFRPRRYRPGNLGTWSGHLPFAVDLIVLLKPSLLVELGTHYGESYFGMCQAVEENRVSCKCYAVDTWQGDPHAGFYDESVFTEVQTYNRANYASFSHLLRMTFEAAEQNFGDETIDLLHIDGLHTYEAVRRDFDRWWPKIRPGGAVLMHDTAVRHGDFGVWKLWEELSPQLPSFEFTHSWGLGVLLKPDAAAASTGPLRAFFSGTPAEQDFLRHYYASQAQLLEFLHRGATRTGAGQTFRVFPGLADGYREDTSVAADINLREWQHVRLELPQGSGHGPIRVDPAESPAVIEFAGAQLRRAADGAVLRSWTNAEFREWRMAADLVLIPGDDPTRLLSTGNDPQLQLPELNPSLSDQPLVFEARVRIDDDLSEAISLLTGEAPAGEPGGQARPRGARSVTVFAERDAALIRSEQLSAEVRHLQAERLAVAADYRRVHTVNESLETEIAALKERLDAERQRRVADADEMRRELNVMLNSRSWRLTAPLRGLFRALR